MTTSLDAEIADAEARGDWRRADELNARKLTDLSRRTHPVTGAIQEPEHEGESAAAPTEETGPEAGSFDGGVRPHRQTTPDDAIADAEARGDWQAVDALNAQKLADAAARMNPGH